MTIWLHNSNFWEVTRLQVHTKGKINNQKKFHKAFSEILVIINTTPNNILFFVLCYFCYYSFFFDIRVTYLLSFHNFYQVKQRLMTQQQILTWACYLIILFLKKTTYTKNISWVQDCKVFVIKSHKPFLLDMKGTFITPKIIKYEEWNSKLQMAEGTEQNCKMKGSPQTQFMAITNQMKSNLKKKQRGKWNQKKTTLCIPKKSGKK